MPSAGTVRSRMASAEKLPASACSASVQRKTPDSDAPVTATRTPSANLAAKTATSGKREATWMNFSYRAACGIGKRTSVMS